MASWTNAPCDRSRLRLWRCEPLEARHLLAGVVVEARGPAFMGGAETRADGSFEFVEPIAAGTVITVRADSVPSNLVAAGGTEFVAGKDAAFDFRFTPIPPPQDAPTERPSNTTAWGLVGAGVLAVGAGETALGLRALRRGGAGS